MCYRTIGQFTSGLIEMDLKYVTELGFKESAKFVLSFVNQSKDATDAELADAKTYLTRHPENNKTRLSAVKREIRRRIKREAT